MMRCASSLTTNSTAKFGSSFQKCKASCLRSMKMPSKWTHSICRECRNRENPGRVAIVLRDICDEICCFCGKPHTSGIHIRDNWAFTPCRGETGIHKEDSDARVKSPN